MTPLEHLGREVAQHRDADPARVANVNQARARLASPLRRAAPAARARKFALGAAVLVAAALVMRLRSSTPAPLTFTAGASPGGASTWLTSTSSPLPLRFSDGTSLALDPGASARVTAIDARGASVVVERGRLTASVVHRGDSRWLVSAGPYEVHVTGTSFDVAWEPDTSRFTLHLTEGSVVIEGCTDPTSYQLTAGQSFVATCENGRRSTVSRTDRSALSLVVPKGDEAASLPSALASGLPSSSASGLPVGLSPPLPAPSTSASGLPADRPPANPLAVERPRLAAAPPARSAAPPSASSPGGAPTATASAEPRAISWQEHARAGRHAQAVRALGARVEAEREEASAADLLLLADLARSSGDGAGEEESLLALRRRFPSDPRAAIAAFFLGRRDFDTLGAYPKAAGWFALALREQPAGLFAREAAGRLIEAHERAGDPAAARRAAERYLEDYPNGPHQKLARSLVAR